MVDEKRRAGRDLPFLNWRYILFKWNDSDEEMDAGAASWPQDIGVDRLCWEITDHPEDAFSRRFVPGTPEFEAIRRETWDDSNLGNAIPGRHAAGPDRGAPPVPGLPLIGARRRPLTVRTRVAQSERARLPRHGRAGPAPGPARRAAVRAGRLADRTCDFARATLPRPLGRRRQRGRSRCELEQLPATGTLRAEVRPGQRRRGVVREVRLADDAAAALGAVRPSGVGFARLAARRRRRPRRRPAPSTVGRRLPPTASSRFPRGSSPRIPCAGACPARCATRWPITG